MQLCVALAQRSKHFPESQSPVGLNLQKANQEIGNPKCVETLRLILRTTALLFTSVK